jgi:hypothetical protein
MFEPLLQPEKYNMIMLKQILNQEYKIFTCNKMPETSHKNIKHTYPSYGGVESQGQFIKADQNRLTQSIDTRIWSSIKFVYR